MDVFFLGRGKEREAKRERGGWVFFGAPLPPPPLLPSLSPPSHFGQREIGAELFLLFFACLCPLCFCVCGNCVSLIFFYHHCSCTPAHVACTPADADTSALAQVLAKQSTVAEQMVIVEQPNEIVPLLRELHTEHNLMEDLFNSAMRTSQTGGDGKLNFRQAKRHMPVMFNGTPTEYTEYTFKMKAYVSTLDTGGKGGDILRATATKAKDMDDDEVTNLEVIYWNVYSTVRWHHA